MQKKKVHPGIPGNPPFLSNKIPVCYFLYSTTSISAKPTNDLSAAGAFVTRDAKISDEAGCGTSVRCVKD